MIIKVDRIPGLCPDKVYSSTNDIEKAFNDPFADARNNIIDEISSKTLSVTMDREKLAKKIYYFEADHNEDPTKWEELRIESGVQQYYLEIADHIIKSETEILSVKVEI